MDHLQYLKVVHRDLAARNVLLDQHDRAKVADFGLALCLNTEQSDGKSRVSPSADEDNMFQRRNRSYHSGMACEMSPHLTH